MYRRVIVIILIFAIGLLLCASTAHAAEQENKAIRFFKKLVNWPFSITKKGAETVGETVQKPIATVTTTTSSAVETVTGEPEKIKDVIIEPVKGTGETVTTAIEGTLETPVEGTIEAFEEKEEE